jgi:hypothetical protein
VACKDALSRFGQRLKKFLWRKAGTRESRAYLFAEMLKSLLLGQKDKAVSQTQYGKGRTRFQAKVLAELLWNAELSLLTNLRN